MDSKMDRQRRAARIRVQNFRLKQKLLKAMNEANSGKLTLKTEKPSTGGQVYTQVEPSLISIALNRALDDNDINKSLAGHEVYVTADALGSLNSTNACDNFSGTESIVNGVARILEDSLQAMTQQLTQTMAETENRLTRRLASLEAKVSNVQNDLNDIKVMLEDDDDDVIVREHDNIVGFEEFQSRYGLSLPLKTSEDFDKFEANLQKPEFYADFKTHLITTTNCHQEVKINCTKIFKKFCKKEVLANYTAKRPGKSKKSIFNKTTFFSCLHDSLTHVYYNPRLEDGTLQDPKIPAYDDGILSSAIGLVFNNAKDWEGGRLDRLKQKTDTNSGDPILTKKRKIEVEEDENSDS